MKKITLFACAMLMAMGVQAATELYAVQDGTQLTIYYDGKRVSRNGKVAPTGEHTGWWDYSQGTAIYTIQFDSSVANATPTSTAYWFDGFKGVTSILNLNYLQTRSVTTMERMFRDCENLQSLTFNGSYFITTNVTTMRGMFHNCKALKNLDLHEFSSYSLKSTHAMFLNCHALESITFGTNFKVEKVTDMGQMFDGCTSLTKLNLSGFEVGNVKIFNKMFYGANNLTTIYADYDWKQAAPSTATGTDMFTSCIKLKGENGSKYSSSAIDLTYARPDVAGTKGYFTKSACPTPRDLSASDITATTATITWAIESKQMKSTVYYQAETWVGHNDVEVTTSGVVLRNLTPNTTYKVWVRSQCSSTDYSESSRTISFTTGAPGQGVETTPSNSPSKGEKILRDGQLLILIGDKTYDARGAEVK